MEASGAFAERLTARSPRLSGSNQTRQIRWNTMSVCMQAEIADHEAHDHTTGGIATIFMMISSLDCRPAPSATR